MARASKTPSEVNSAPASTPQRSRCSKLIGLLLLMCVLGALALWLNAPAWRRSQYEKMTSTQLIAAAQQNPQDALVATIAARRCLDEGLFEQVEAFLPRAAQAHPDDTSLQVLMGRLAWQSGDPQRAGTLLNSALQAAPFDTEAMRWTAEFLLDRGRKTEAESLLRDAVRLEPARGDIWRRLAEIHIDTREYETALKELDEAEKVTPTAVVARLRAAVLSSLDRQSAAEEAARLAVQRQPDAVSYRLLGEIVQKNADDARLREAQGYFQRALQTEPNDKITLQLIALNYRALGEHRKAVQVLRALLKQEPYRTQSYFLLSQSYQALGDAQRAAQVMRIFRQLQPLQEKADRAKLRVLIERGTLASELAHVRALLVLGDVPEARKVLERAWRKDPDNANIQKLARQCEAPPQTIPTLPPDNSV